MRVTNESLVLIGDTSSLVLKNTGVISDEVLYWSQIVCYICLCGTVSLLGIPANAINIIVFIRQGVLKDSSTVSLCALSISDLLSLLFLLWLSVCFILIYLSPPHLPFDPMSMLVVTGGRLHVMFVQISSWLTVYIAFERCMCVVFPFKVGRMFTPQRAATICFGIFIGNPLFGYLPLFIVEHLTWWTDPLTNKSIITIHRTENYAAVSHIWSVINAPVVTVLTLTGVFCFSQLTAFRVDASRKWRKSTAPSNNQADKTIRGSKDDDVSVNKDIGSRDKRLTKMIRAVCVIFLICFTPDLIFVITEIIVPEIRPAGLYNNLFFFLYGFSFLLEGLNATLSILVYYTMSSRYKSEFRKLFGFEKVSNQ